MDVYWKMKRKGVRLNEFTYFVILTALPVISPSEVHAQIVQEIFNCWNLSFRCLCKVHEAAKFFRHC